MTNIQEIWKPIKNYEGLYEISNLGRVKSLGHFIQARNKWNTYNRFFPERIHKYHINKNGRPRFELSHKGKQKIFSGNRLVASAFIPNPNNLPCVCHKDDNPLNNCVDNLFWGTHADNIADKCAKGRQAKGEKNAQSKLTAGKVYEIRELQKKGMPIKDIQKDFGTSLTNIYNIINGKTWMHL